MTYICNCTHCQQYIACNESEPRIAYISNILAAVYKLLHL